MFDFNKGRITMVIAPVDMRSGLPPWRASPAPTLISTFTKATS